MTGTPKTVAMALPTHEALVELGIQPGGYAKVEAMLDELHALKKAHIAGRHAHGNALKHIEILIEDVDHALRDARGRLDA